MPHVLLIGNPARRRGRRRKSRSASPAQRAARARFAAMARARSKSTRRHRRRSPRVIHANPVFRRRSHRRVRRNPISLGMFRGVGGLMMNAAVGAGGAIANDVAFGFAAMALPASAVSPVSSTGGLNPFYYAAKTGSALLLGFAAKMLIGHRAVPMMEGALTVTLHDAMKQFLAGSGLPVPLGAAPYNAGRVIPPMPMQHNLRAYVGPRGAMNRAPLEAYVGTSAREAVRR